MAASGGRGKGKGGAKRSARASSRSELHRRKKPATRRPARRSPRRRKGSGWFSRLFTARNIGFAFTTFLTLVILGLMSLAYFMHDLPDISTLTRVTKAPSILLQSTDGDIIGSSGHIYGEYVRYEEIPRSLIKAVIATEDRNFFNHFGIDPWGLLRAMVANVRAGRIVQGGSTITQQLAKNVFLTPERSIKRKVQELIIALAMERKYSKQQIITVYLNRVYFGAGTYGIDAASRRYFDKPAAEMLLPESAMIAGLLKAPSRYAPTSNRELAIGRAKQVLINMVDAGLLEEAQMKAAASMYSSLSFPEYVNSSGQRYYIDWILDQIPEYVGNIKTDLIVTTAFNAELQEKAEKAVAKVMSDKTVAKRKVGQVALLTMSPDGGVLAMVGGRDYATSQYNRATQARRQPGSSFKLFVYLAALEAGWRPYHTIEDAPINIDGWQPSNYNGRYEGLVTLRQAFENSINTVSVRLSESIGRGKVIDMAHRLGLKSQMNTVPSIALGVTTTSLLEMVTAYSHLANNGQLVMPYGILSIKDVYGNVIYRRKAPTPTQILPLSTVKQMNDMLLAVVESGTGRGAAIGRPAAGKTGTSQDYRDAWFIGFTPQLVTGVWVGNDDNSATGRVTGGSLPARIWSGFMKAALEGIAVRNIPRESGGNGGWWGGSGERQPRALREERQNFWDGLFSNDVPLERDEGIPNDPTAREEGLRR